MIIKELSSAILTRRNHKRIKGCLTGFFVGDAFGAQYESLSHKEVAKLIEERGTKLGKSVSWDCIVPGQVTDASEMAIALFNAIFDTIEMSRGQEIYNLGITMRRYKHWHRSGCFDVEETVLKSLKCKNCREILKTCTESKTNGALMRIAPLSIAYALHCAKHCVTLNEAVPKLLLSACQDAKLTHPNPVCLTVNEIYALGLFFAMVDATNAKNLIEIMMRTLYIWLEDAKADRDEKEIKEINEVIGSFESGLNNPPSAKNSKDSKNVLFVFQNAIYQLTHANTMKEAIVNSCLLGGDTATTSCVAGALYGAVNGGNNVPKQWLRTVTECDTSLGKADRNQYQSWPRDIERIISDLYNAI